MSLSNVSHNNGLTQEEKRYLLTPLAMVIPNGLGVYGISQYQSSKIITESQFRHYVPIQIKVGTPDNYYTTAAYAFGANYYLAQEA